MRRGEAAAGTPDHEIMYCEAFVPTLLRSAGFQVSDLNALVPGAYDERLMIIPGPFVGLPLGLADGFDGHSEMIHPVYGTREFLTRLLSRFSHKGWYHHVNDMLEDAELECLPPEMLEEFRQRTHDLLTA
jgi:hypothetical protein